ncbi:DNA-methyltransferase [Methanococcus sp. CF]
MKTVHNIYFKNSKSMSEVKDNSVQLVVTSPPYPMIEMWDELFCMLNHGIKSLIDLGNCKDAFELMHQELDKTWEESYRILSDGGFLCINIGDATRKINEDFQIYPNHSRIIKHCRDIGFQMLPGIIWRKQTNSPNKFMGSGMLPAGAYVTLEHEHVLIFRKGSKRDFKSKVDSENRRNSAFFWEERNNWFSDVWTDLKGTRQILSKKELRNRSAAYPLELASRLINMYSLRGDTVLDPFLGTGTTTFSAMINGRNSIGYEIEPNFKEYIHDYLKKTPDVSREMVYKRINDHVKFISERENSGKEVKYKCNNYDFKVITKQEMDIIFEIATSIKIDNGEYTVEYTPLKDNLFYF